MGAEDCVWLYSGGRWELASLERVPDELVTFTDGTLQDIADFAESARELAEYTSTRDYVRLHRPAIALH
jgi:hypothetical protein